MPGMTRRRGIVIVSFCTLLLSGGVNLSFGVFVTPLADEFGWSRSAVSLAAAVNLILYGITQPFFGRLIDLYGPRRVIVTGVALMAAGNLLMSTTGHLWQLYVFYGLLGGAGFTASTMLPMSILVLRWFQQRRGLILGAIATGLSLGQALFYQIASLVIAHAGWRTAYAVFGLLLLALLPACVLLIRNAPDERPSAPAPGIAGVPAAAAVWPALRRRTFVLIAVAYLTCGFTDFMISTHLAPLANDRGLGNVVGARALSILAVANIAGLLLAGRLADTVGPRGALIAVYAVRAVAMTMLPFVGEAGGLYVFAALFGATFFTTAPLTSGLINEIYGMAMTGRVLGAVNVVHHLAGASGSYLAGVVFDVRHSYLSIFVAGTIMVYGAIVLVALVDPRRERARANSVGRANY
jgi:MFS family permease